MNLKSTILLLFFVLSTVAAFAQENSVGLLSYNKDKSYEGYNLIFPHRQPDIFLLDNCGEVVHTWEGPEDTVPGNTAYILENGNIVCARRPANITADPIWAGGGGATVEIRSWDNELLWEYTKNDSLERLHHDIAVKENGNILMIVWELMTEAEAIQAGRDTALMAQNEVWPDKIIEVNMAKEIVWEWRAQDHLIQDYDSTKDNFGVVADNLGKIDFNYDTNDGHPDWLHSNAMDYHEERGQILLSVPQFDEIWLIDNTTTTAEAAGDFGGRTNRGGEIVYRWGNNYAYDVDTLGSNQFYYQHDVQWMDDFITPSHPDFGKILVYNNRIGSDFSAVSLIDPQWDMYKWAYGRNTDGTWAPEAPYKTLTHPDPQAMYSTGLSGAQPLANGNYLINSGRQGYAFELTPDNEIVWEYVTPINFGVAATQGDTLELNDNLTFRVTRYPADYPAFDGRDLSSQGFIELEPNEDYCERLVPVRNATRLNYNLTISPNPTSGWMAIEYDYAAESSFEVFDMLGRSVKQFVGMGARKYVDMSELEAGIYFLQINGGETQRFVIEK